MAGAPLRLGKRSGHASGWRGTRYPKASCTTSSGWRPSWRAAPTATGSSRPLPGAAEALRRAATPRPSAAGRHIPPPPRGARRIAPAHRQRRPAGRFASARLRPASRTVTGPEVEALDGPAEKGGAAPVRLQEVMGHSGHAVATTRAGRPPPDPRDHSRRPGGGGAQADGRNPWACRICGSSGPGARKARARASPRAS